MFPTYTKYYNRSSYTFQMGPGCSSKAKIRPGCLPAIGKTRTVAYRVTARDTRSPFEPLFSFVSFRYIQLDLRI